jgi:uncharacterized membrane protein YdbT with pleckstrin-like domain
MSDEMTRRLLKQTTLFAKLKRSDLNEVAKLVKRERYAAESVVCQQGDIGRTAYFVESGVLRVLHINPAGIEQEVAQLKAGDYFGETSLLVGEPRDATVEVVREITVQVARDAVLLSLTKDDFDQLIEKQPAILDVLQMRPDVEKKRYAPRFKWLDPDEVVIVHTHKHKVVLISHLILPSFVLLATVIVCGYWYLKTEAPLALILGGALALFSLLFGVYLYLDHENDDYIVTNKRVVHEEREFLVRERRAEAPLRAVQDIQQVQEGVWSQLFDLGDLTIETAGERGTVVFRQIPNPAEVQEAIFEQMQRVQARARAEERATVRDVLRDHFDISTPKELVPEPKAPPSESHLRLNLPSWLPASMRLFRYFVPPPRRDQGDIVIWHKHWIALIKPIGLPTILIVAATVAAIWILAQDPGNMTRILIVYGTVMFFLFPWWLLIFNDWKNDTYRVTASRIIDTEMRLFWREERREASLRVIQNINLEIPGFLGRFLNYGSVTIETAGAQAFTFDHVHDPRGVQAEIFRRVEAFQQRLRQQEAQRHQNELLDWFTAYDKMQRSVTLQQARDIASATPSPSLPQQES